MPDYYYYYNDAVKRLAIIKETYDYAISHGDKNVYLIEGKEFFGEKDWVHCTVDGTHPNDLGFYKMADVIGKKLKEVLKLKK